MQECSLDLIFYKGQLDHLFFWWGRSCFLPIDETRFLDKVKAFIFVTIESVFIVAITIGLIRKFNFSFNKLEYI